MQKTSYDIRISDWSSDVCSSDLQPWRAVTTIMIAAIIIVAIIIAVIAIIAATAIIAGLVTIAAVTTGVLNGAITGAIVATAVQAARSWALLPAVCWVMRSWCAMGTGPRAHLSARGEGRSPGERL